MFCSPWCISRQLWWGHRIPAYKIVEPHNINESDTWIVARTEEEAVQKAAQKLQVPASKLRLEQGKYTLFSRFLAFGCKVRTQKVHNSMNYSVSATTFNQKCLIRQDNFKNSFPSPSDTNLFDIFTLLQMIRSIAHLMNLRFPKLSDIFHEKFYFQIQMFWIRGFHLLYFPFQFLNGHNR